MRQRQGDDAIERTLDTYVGILFSNLVSLAIMVTTAATLHVAGNTDIPTSSQAAEALKPAAGEARKRPAGLTRKPKKAKAFYATVAVATPIGTAIGFSSIDPIKALIWSAVINGVVAVPVITMMMMLMTPNKKMTGQFVITGPLHALGWLTSAVMVSAAVLMAVPSVFWLLVEKDPFRMPARLSGK